MYGLALGRAGAEQPNSIQNAALGILRRYGTNAHVYLPGANGVAISGLSSGNYVESTFNTLASVDSVVGGVRDPVGSIDATQATTANKPALRRGLYNLLANSAWFTLGDTTVAGNRWTYPTGGFSNPNRNPIALPAGTYTVALDCASVSGSASATVDAQNINSVALTIPAQRGIVAGTLTIGAARSWVDLELSAAGVIDVYAFGIFNGTLTAAQILSEGGIPLTTSAAASNPSAGRYWLGSDSSDSLQLGSVPFQYADDWFICAGAACNNKAVYPGVFESLGGTARIYTYFDAGGIAVTQLRNDSGADTYIVGPAFGDGESVVLSSYKQSGQVCTGLNGTDGTPQSAPAGTFTLSSSKLLNGLDGKRAAGVIIKGQVSAADRLTIKRWVASQTPNGPQF